MVPQTQGASIVEGIGVFALSSDTSIESLSRFGSRVEPFGFIQLRYDDLNRGFVPSSSFSISFDMSDLISIEGRRFPIEVSDGYTKYFVLGVERNAFRASINQLVGGEDLSKLPLGRTNGFLGARWIKYMSPLDIFRAAAKICGGRCGNKKPCRMFGCICNVGLGACV
jgi:hypothetical protein